MATISSLGVGSGLDIRGLVDQLVAAEVLPTSNRLDIREATLQAELSAFGTLKSVLSSLQGSLQALSDVGPGRTATSSHTELIDVGAADHSAPGHYEIEVSALAQAQSLASTAYTSPADIVGSGTLTFQFGTTDYDAQSDTYNGFTANPERSAETLIIDDTNNTLEGIRDAINEASIGVNAAIINDGSGYRLLLSSDDTGAANSLQISVTDDGGSGLTNLAFDGSATNLEQTIAARDALMVINGLSVSSSSNSVNDVIDGLTLMLKGAEPGEIVRVDVARDEGAVRESINAFIDGYNTLIEQIEALTGYDPDTQQGSTLTGDSTIRTVVSQLRNSLLTSVEGASETYDYLVDLGLESDADGRLSLDGERFDAALQEDYEGVVSLLNGSADILGSTLDGFLQTGGTLEARTDGLIDRIDEIGDEREALDLRADALEARYVRQFTALDTLLAQLQSTSNFLSQQLANLPTSADLNRSN